MPKIMIQNEARFIDAAPNANLREAILEGKAELYSGCGRYINCRGHGFCGKCEVIVIEGAEHLTERTPREISRLKTYDASRRLACQCGVIGDAEMTVNTPCP